MTNGAAAPPPAGAGRRGALGIVVGLVAFLFVAPPLLLLGPLLLLLLLSRPATAREWLWIGLAGAAAASLGNPTRGGLANLVVNAGAIVMSGAFAVASHWLRAVTLTRAALAAGVAAAGVGIWIEVTGVPVADLDAAVLADLQRAFDLLFPAAATEQRQAALAMASWLTRLFPGLTILQAMAGAALAWGWYHRIARHPVGTSPAGFRTFRFNDHLVWGAIFTLGAALLPLGEPFDRVVANGLMIWVGLYAARGLAVVAAFVAPWSFPARLLLVGLGILALPVAMAGTVTLGLADTWLDWRRRLAASPRGGLE
jgi:hypothetical protein